ncbi:MAG: glycosyltransferase family 2 protein [Acetobacteraceae bacterium]|jgi:dolichol-phosphate mannosyltransferase
MKEDLHLSIADDTGAGATLSVIVPSFNERPNVAPMIAKLDAALRGVEWEVVYVDDNSPDGTAGEVRRIARIDPRVRCIRRVGRRGLASAVIEGVLSCSATYVAVIDGDLQHDETRLPVMLTELRSGQYDLAVASRYVEGGNDDGLATKWRHTLSGGGAWLAQMFLPVKLTDPMSGFFMMPRAMFENLATHLTGQGFKILLDLVLSAPTPLRVKEVPAEFHERVAGESKLDAQVVLQFGGLLLDKTFAGYLPLRFISFAVVGAIGVMVHLAVLALLREWTALGFGAEQTIATVAAMVFNFELNNAVTYADQRLRGPALWRGLLLFMAVCGVGAVANIGIAKALYDSHTVWSLAGAMGAVIGVVWNYAVSATLVWRTR